MGTAIINKRMCLSWVMLRGVVVTTTQRPMKRGYYWPTLTLPGMDAKYAHRQRIVRPRVIRRQRTY